VCTTCGCGDHGFTVDGKPLRYRTAAHDPRRLGGRSHPAAHDASRPPRRIVQVETDILAKNGAFANENRRRFADAGILALNLMSSPGAGKTSLLVRTIEEWGNRTPVAVIEGDQQTSRDADRVREAGACAVQINTRNGCHLDAHMVAHAIDDLALPSGGLLFIENVGNLVCPAAFDLGEAQRVVILSVAEGDDKPLKYPEMFRAADLLLVSKSDLMPHVDFDVPAALADARRVRPDVQALVLSARTGDGFDAWLAWLERAVSAARRRSAPAHATAAHAD
jgi:hydrogenase nickel incorporation protein HypB